MMKCEDVYPNAVSCHLCLLHKLYPPYNKAISIILGTICFCQVQFLILFYFFDLQLYLL